MREKKYERMVIGEYRQKTKESEKERGENEE